MKEKKARVEDAMHATKAAVEEGIVPGGGVALLRASAVLESFTKDESLDQDERLGVEIVRRACEEPCRWIASNAGFEGSIVASKVKEASDRNWGFNAQSEQYEDLVQAGVIDPTKVVRAALTNASSIAALLLTTEALVSELPEKEKPAPPMPHGPGMDDY
jgi:chaperonin GroEL